jgi:hypothetical protein
MIAQFYRLAGRNTTGRSPKFSSGIVRDAQASAASGM